MSKWNRPMRRYDPDLYAQDWTGRYARSAGASALYAHTIRRRDKRGWRTWCGTLIERPTDDLAPGAADCIGCRTRRDAA